MSSGLEEQLDASLAAARSAASSVDASDYGSAVAFFGDAAAAASSALLSALCAQASAAVSAKQYSAARTASCAAVRADPNAGVAWYWVGAAEFAAGNAKPARAAFARAADLETDQVKKASFLECVERCDKASPAVETVDVSGVPNPSSVSPTRASAARAVPSPTAAPAQAAKPGPKVAATPENTPTFAPVVFDEDDVLIKAAALHPPPPPPDARMEWYQAAGSVSIDIYAKNVDKASSLVDITDSRVVARLVRPEKEDYVLERDLFGDVDPASSSWEVSKFKVEIKLTKAVGSLGEWKTLAREGGEVSAGEKARLDGQRKVQAVAAKKKNWDAIAAKELENEKEESGPMDVFKTIYADADDDVRRAMMKSYSESGGKVLSTDWSDVGKRKVTYEPSNDSKTT
jgi:SGS domain/CS domain